MPLLGVASALAVVGYALALENPRPVPSESASYSTEPRRSDGGSAVAREAVELRFRPGPSRRLQLRFDQSESVDVSEVNTRVDLEIDETRRSRPGEKPGVQFHRTYRKAGVSIGEGETVVGPRISRQIESLLDGVKSVVEVDAIGKRVDSRWKSVTNPQIRQSLRMLRHAQSLLMPRPRRGSVSVGDSWQYRLSADHLESEQVESIEGDVRIRESLVELLDDRGTRIAVIERKLEAEASGRVQMRGPSEAQRFELSAEGSGRARFAIERGAVVESHLAIERDLELEGNAAEPRQRTGQIEWSLAEKRSPGER